MGRFQERDRFMSFMQKANVRSTWLSFIEVAAFFCVILLAYLVVVWAGYHAVAGPWKRTTLAKGLVEGGEDVERTSQRLENTDTQRASAKSEYQNVKAAIEAGGGAELQEQFLKLRRNLREAEEIYARAKTAGEDAKANFDQLTEQAKEMGVAGGQGFWTSLGQGFGELGGRKLFRTRVPFVKFGELFGSLPWWLWGIEGAAGLLLITVYWAPGAEGFDRCEAEAFVLFATATVTISTITFELTSGWPSYYVGLFLSMVLPRQWLIGLGA